MIRIGQIKIFSIGEKKKYFKRQLKREDLTKKQRKEIKKKLKYLENIKPNRYDVYITNDKYFYKNAQSSKSRRVIVLNNNDNFLDVVPVKRNNIYVSLEKFTGDRMVQKNKVVNGFQLDNLYDKKSLKRYMKKDYLTKKDKRKINKMFFDNK